MKFRTLSDGYVAWWCPGCDEAHHVPVEGTRPWVWNKSIDAPTLSPSVLVNVGGSNPTVPICHVFIRDGKIQFLPDCTHKLAGKIVEIPDWESQ